MSALRVRQMLGALAVVLGVATFGFASPAPAQADEIRDVQRRANQAAQDIADAEEALEKTDERIAALEAQTAAVERQLADLGDSVEELVIAQYMSSGDIPLITEEDLNEGVKAAAYSRYIGKDRLDQIDRYIELKAQLNDSSTELADVRSQQERSMADLENAAAELQTELERLEELQRQRQEEAERKRQAEEKAAAEKAAADKTAAEKAAAEKASATTAAKPRVQAQSESSSSSGAATPIIHSGGGMVCPVAGPVSFVDSWGASRGGGSRRHKGVDMMAAYGTPVVAPVSGVVTHRGNSVGGLSFHLVGDDGNYYYGTHLQGYENVGAGHVQAGTVIGYVGATGNAPASAPHLHFEIHPNARGYSTAVNPYPATAAACF